MWMNILFLFTLDFFLYLFISIMYNHHIRTVSSTTHFCGVLLWLIDKHFSVEVMVKIIWVFGDPRFSSSYQFTKTFKFQGSARVTILINILRLTTYSSARLTFLNWVCCDSNFTLSVNKFLSASFWALLLLNLSALSASLFYNSKRYTSQWNFSLNSSLLLCF